MSERGSFVTEYVYCPECFDVLCEVLCQNDKYIKGVVIPSWQPNRNLPIIAGKIGDLAPGGELVAFGQIGFILGPRLCHPVRIAVLAEDGSHEVFTFGSNR